MMMGSLLPGYVGAATVGAAAWWFTVSEDGPQVTLYQLVGLSVGTFQPPSALPPPLLTFPSSHRATSSSAAQTTQSSTAWTAMCSSRPTPWPWPCQCSSPLRCATLSTGKRDPESGDIVLRDQRKAEYITESPSVVSVQPIGEPVPAANASLGEHLAAGGHLPLHVSPLPHPLCGTSACEFNSPVYLNMTSSVRKAELRHKSVDAPEFEELRQVCIALQWLLGFTADLWCYLLSSCVLGENNQHYS